MSRLCQILSCLAWAAATPVFSLNLEELEKRVPSLRGDDFRLFRPDATAHTVKRQQEGDCANLTLVAHVLLDATSSIEHKKLAEEYCIFCITDNSTNRAIFGEVPGIHKAVIGLMAHEVDFRLSFLACHLIYIATFANAKNHEAFQREGAVEALAKLAMNSNAIIAEKMWAAAALANLAASYCDTADGRCDWEWTLTHEDIQLGPHSPLISDGSTVRLKMLEIDGLVDTLIDVACEGPVSDDDEDVVTVGESARDGDDDDRDEIFPWAAMACLRNLALEPSAKPMLEDAMRCACFMKESIDWVEASKSKGFMHHMRRQDESCWLNEEKDQLCVDGNFLDQGFFLCAEYDDASEDDCENAVDIFTNEPASELCCTCGGGTMTE